MKKSWQAVVDGVNHDVDYEMNDWSGRYSLRVDGASVLQGRFSWADQWGMFTSGGAILWFPVGGSQAAVRITSGGMTWKADFDIDVDRRADPAPSVALRTADLPPWWGWLLFGIALAATLAAVGVDLVTPARRFPVGLLGAAGALLCLRFSTRRDWPQWLRVSLTLVAAAASVTLASLSLRP